MRTRFVAIALLAALAVSGCSTVRVTTDWDRQFDFTGLSAYEWARSAEAPEKPAPDRVFLDRRIRRAVDDELAAKGYRKADGKADFLVVYQAKVRDHTDVYRHGPYWYGWRDAHRYRAGSLVLGIVDKKKDEIVWSGWADGIISDPGESEEAIRDAVMKILETFPPQ